MQSRSPARFLAPLALVIVFFAILTVLNSEDDPQGTTSVTTTQQTTTTTTKARARKKQATTYTVKSGDVLSSIAEKTGVPLERLLDLNADLDPQALRTGQKIKLRR